MVSGLYVKPYRHTSPFASSWLSKSTSMRKAMSMTATEKPNVAETAEITSGPIVEQSSSDDFSQYAPGQEYEGKVMSAKKFGVFVDIGQKFNVLVPRSLLNERSYDKLKEIVDNKSEEKIRVELISVNAENQTLRGKFISGNFKGRPDLSSLAAKDLGSKQFNATVVSAHEFGVFAEIEELGVEGLIPASKLPRRLKDKAAIREAHPVNSRILVKIEEINVETKKLVLSARVDNRIDVSTRSTLVAAPETWLQGVVQRVTNYGLFIRPAGYDVQGIFSLPLHIFANHGW